MQIAGPDISNRSICVEKHILFVFVYILANREMEPIYRKIHTCSRDEPIFGGMNPFSENEPTFRG